MLLITLSIYVVSRITYKWNPPNAKNYEPSITPTPTTTRSSTNAVTTTSTCSSIKATTTHKHKSPANDGSITFKGVLQLMNHTDDVIYYFKSGVIKKSVSNEKVISGNNHVVNVSRINDNVPENPPFSAAYYNNINLHVLNSVIALTIGIFFVIFN
jgi:hypothetical protein